MGRGRSERRPRRKRRGWLHDEVVALYLAPVEDEQRRFPHPLAVDEDTGGAHHDDVGNRGIRHRHLRGLRREVDELSLVDRHVDARRIGGAALVRGVSTGGCQHCPDDDHHERSNSHRSLPGGRQPPAHFFPDCSTHSCVVSRTNTCSAGLPPRSTVMAYVSTLGGGRGALTIRGLGVLAGAGAGVDADESVNRVDAVTPRVSTTLLSRRLRIASISLPSVCASPIFSAWFGASARVTVVTVTGLLSRSSTVWPAARTPMSCRITFEMRSCEPGLRGMLTRTSTRLLGRTKPLSRVASSTLIVMPRRPSGTSIGMSPPLPDSWGASLASSSGSPATIELRTTRPSASAMVRTAPGATDPFCHETSSTCALLMVYAISMLTAATTML